MTEKENVRKIRIVNFYLVPGRDSKGLIWAMEAYDPKTGRVYDLRNSELSNGGKPNKMGGLVMMMKYLHENPDTLVALERGPVLTRYPVVSASLRKDLAIFVRAHNIGIDRRPKQMPILHEEQYPLCDD